MLTDMSPLRFGARARLELATPPLRGTARRRGWGQAAREDGGSLSGAPERIEALGQEEPLELLDVDEADP